MARRTGPSRDVAGFGPFGSKSARAGRPSGRAAATGGSSSAAPRLALRAALSATPAPACLRLIHASPAPSVCTRTCGSFSRAQARRVRARPRIEHRVAPTASGSCDDGGVADLELLDCGGGRRLERFGDVLVDRPAPAARPIPRGCPPADWAKPDLRWAKGAWVRGRRPRPVAGPRGRPHARVPGGGRRPGGRVPGARRDLVLARPGRSRVGGERLGRPPEVLSLFAYTGGASLACAAGRGAGRPRGRVEAGGRVGAAQRGAVRPGRRADPLARRRRARVRPARAPARPHVRRRRRSTRRPTATAPARGRSTSDLAALLEDLAAIAGPRAVVRRSQRPHAGLRRRPAGRARPRHLRDPGRRRGARPPARTGRCDARARRLGSAARATGRCAAMTSE